MATPSKVDTVVRPQAVLVLRRRRSEVVLGASSRGSYRMRTNKRPPSLTAEGHTPFEHASEL